MLVRLRVTLISKMEVRSTMLYIVRYTGLWA